MSVGETPETILCGLLMAGASFEDAAREVRGSDFVDPVPRKVFEQIGELARVGAPTDCVTVGERLPELYDDILVWAMRETEGAWSRSNVLHYARMVRRGSRRRKVRELLQDGLDRLDKGEDIDGLAEEITHRMDAASRREERTPAFRGVLQHAAEAVQQAYMLQKTHGFVGESFTLEELDARLGGLWGGPLVVLGARTSVGKSTLAWQIALRSALKGSPVGIIDTEMGERRVGIRCMSHCYGLNNTKLRLGIREEVLALLEHAEKNPLLEMPVHIDCVTRDLYSMMGQIGRWKREHGIRFAVVDYLQKIEVPGAHNRFDARGIASAELQKLAQRLDIPIILVSQLSRDVEKGNRPPVLSDLRESGDIEQNADLVIALHGKLEADELGERDVELHILKAKEGRTGKIPRKYTLHGPTFTVREDNPL